MQLNSKLQFCTNTYQHKIYINRGSAGKTNLSPCLSVFSSLYRSLSLTPSSEASAAAALASAATLLSSASPSALSLPFTAADNVAVSTSRLSHKTANHIHHRAESYGRTSSISRITTRKKKLVTCVTKQETVSPARVHPWLQRYAEVSRFSVRSVGKKSGVSFGGRKPSAIPTTKTINSGFTVAISFQAPKPEGYYWEDIGGLALYAVNLGVITRANPRKKKEKKNVTKRNETKHFL